MTTVEELEEKIEELEKRVDKVTEIAWAAIVLGLRLMEKRNLTVIRDEESMPS